MIAISTGDRLLVWTGEQEVRYRRWADVELPDHEERSASGDATWDDRPSRPSPTIELGDDEQAKLVRVILTGPPGPAGLPGPMGPSA